MAEAVISYSLYGLAALIVGIPAAVFAAAVSKKTPTKPPIVTLPAPIVTPPAALQASVPVPRPPSASSRHTERLTLGYQPPAARVCGICQKPLSAATLRTHDGLWRCAAHKHVQVG